VFYNRRINILKGDISMSVQKAIKSIISNNLDEMKTNFNASLTTKAVEKLEERKIVMAQQYFGQEKA